MQNFILNIHSADDDLLLSDESLQCYAVNAEMDFSCLKNICGQLLKNGKIVLLAGDKAPQLRKELNADGIIADLSASNSIKKDIAEIRKLCGQCILGIISRNRRHEAMIVSENEPDFIIFKIWKDGKEQTLSLAEWYNDFFLLQMAVMPQDENSFFEKYPADIVILSPQDYKIFVAKK